MTMPDITMAKENYKSASKAERGELDMPISEQEIRYTLQSFDFCKLDAVHDMERAKGEYPETAAQSQGKVVAFDICITKLQELLLGAWLERELTKKEIEHLEYLLSGGVQMRAKPTPQQMVKDYELEQILEELHEMGYKVELEEL